MYVIMEILIFNLWVPYNNNKYKTGELNNTTTDIDFGRKMSECMQQPYAMC